MRGLAALVVVGFHAIFLFPTVSGALPDGMLADVLSHGWIGVDFFFVLSGFLLSLPLVRVPGQVRHAAFWRQYMGKRWFRIAPPYFASIIVSLFLVGQLSYLVTAKRDMLLHVLYVHNLAPDSLMSINWVYWTLAIEFQFYLILPLFVLLFVRRSWPWALAACVAASVAWRAAFYSPSDAVHTFWMANQLPGFLGHFAFGIVAAKAYVEARSGLAWRRYVVPGAAISFVAVPLLSFSRGMESLQASWMGSVLASATLRPALGIGFAALLMWLLQGGPLVRSVLSARPLQMLGEMSYSVYLMHVPIITFLVLQTPTPTSFGAFAAYLMAGALLGSAVFYILVERPSLRLKECLMRARAPRPTTGLIAPAPSAVPSMAIPFAVALASTPSSSGWSEAASSQTP